MSVQKKILIVDEDELILYGLEKALQSEGVEVTSARTASEAVVKLSLSAYDLCLLDVHLPDSSGMALMRMLHDIYPRVKVVIMTASYIDDTGMGESLQEAMKSGGCHFVAKPFDLNELKDIVVQALHHDDGFRPGFKFTWNNFFERKARKNMRRSFAGEIRYSMSDIESGEGGRLQLLARAIDLSEHGVGFYTEYPLQPSQVLSFEHDDLHRTGLVAWSTMVDERTCRAGVRFA